MADNNPVDPAIDPEVPQELPSEVASGFYDNTPVSELQAEALQEVPPPVEDPPLDEIKTENSTTLTPAELDALAESQGVSAGDGGNIPESFLYRNEELSQAQNPYSNYDTGTFTGDIFNLNSSESDLNAALAAQRLLGQNQPTIAALRKQVNNGDWRVRLRLAPQSKYLYNASSPGILQPLQVTDGVIFPYTPKIDTVYRAYYDQYDLTHSNYRGYFYKNSAVESVQMSCTFTAQSTAEANYLLAVITFFKSVTKMFYGQDAQRGAPPPLVYLSGLGQYQFNENPCVVTTFNYTLPDNVDYIRAQSTNNVGINMTNQRSRQSVSTNSLFGSLNRLAAALLPKGAIQDPLAPPTLGLNSPTYVPTKIDIVLSLLPIQSRQQVSQQFSLKEFANGNLLKGGFW